jgi:uncharacterized membrane protein
LLGVVLGLFGITRVYYLSNESPDEQAYNAHNERRRAFVAGATIVVGWFSVIYGMTLLLLALRGG